MKNWLPIFGLFMSISLFGQEALNVELLGIADRGAERYSGSWVYVAPDSTEYGLVGALTGTAVYALADSSLRELGFVEGPSSRWREITVVGQHAYVTTEGSGPGEGMQVIDLSGLPDSVRLVTTYTTTFRRAHILQRNVVPDSLVYVSGTSTTRGVHLLDVSNPEAPVEVGLYAPGHYIHDCHVRGDFLYAAAFNEGTIDVVDISDRTNPVLRTRIPDVVSAVHSAWTTADGNYLFVVNERDGLVGKIWDISDLDDVTTVATYSANRESLVHNPYIRGDYAFIAHNTEGLRVLDIADPTLPIEVGYYDDYAGTSGGFSGLWSACPFTLSGKIIGGDRTGGMYIWSFNNTKAKRFYGTVVDARTQEPIAGATILVEEQTTERRSDFDGTFGGGGIATHYRVTVRAPRYFQQVIELDLTDTDRLDFTVSLRPFFIVWGNNDATMTTHSTPNPFSSTTTIELTPFPTVFRYQLYNSTGKLMLTENVVGLDRYQLNIPLEKGMYWYQLIDTAGAVLATGKMIKQ